MTLTQEVILNNDQNLSLSFAFIEQILLDSVNFGLIDCGIVIAHALTVAAEMSDHYRQVLYAAISAAFGLKI